MKKIILCLLFSLCLFSKEEYKNIGKLTQKQILDIAFKNLKYSCVLDKKVIRIEGRDFVGHVDEEGKPYGEWYTKNGDLRQCFLDNKIIYEVGEGYLSIETDELRVKKYDEDFKYISIVFRDENKFFFYEKQENGSYEINNAISVKSVPFPILPMVMKIGRYVNY